jgi:hypothetical protein
MSNHENTGPTLLPGETVTSDSPKVDLGPAKAIAATIATIAVAFLGALGVAITDGEITAGEWVTIATATIVSTGLVGGATFITPTSVTRKR